MNATRLTITTLLDLTAASAHGAPAAADSAAFDAHLQVPPPTKRGEREAPSPAERPREQAATAASDNRREAHDSPSQTAADQPSSTAAAAAESEAEATSAASSENNSSADEYTAAADSAAAAQTLIEQSLAAVAQQAAVAPETQPSSLAPPTEDTAASEPTFPGAERSTRRGADKSPIPATAVHSTVIARATGAPLVSQPDHADGPQGREQALVSDPAAVAVAVGGETTLAEAPTSAPETFSSAPGVSLQGVSSHSELSQDSSDRSPAESTLDPTVDLAAAGQRSVVESATSSTSQPTAPPVAAAALPAAAPDQPQSNPERNAAQGVPGPGPVSRNRLPGQLLAQAEGAAPRRGASEVDATRLLHRVARAFAAAQERDGEVRLRLSPPELGALRLELRIQDGAMIAHLETETEAAQAAILENLPALRERLAEQGVRIERFDVDLMQRQSPDSSNQSRGGQEDKLAPLPRGPAAPRRSPDPSVPAPAIPRASATAGGLNVIV